MISNIVLSDILFLDIETVSQYSNFDSLSEQEQQLWDEKTVWKRNLQSADTFYQKAAIWAEFGKIVCISVGFFQPQQTNQEDKRCFRIKSFYAQTERELLLDFAGLLNQYFNTAKYRLCAHNGKEFDFPYIARRMVVHKIPLPKILQFAGKKPWEIPHLDTMELWKFGDHKNFTSLKLLTHILGIPCPKDDIDGSQVTQVYYENKDEKGLDRIVKYCQKDTLTVAQLYLRLSYQELLCEETEVVIIS